MQAEHRIYIGGETIKPRTLVKHFFGFTEVNQLSGGYYGHKIDQLKPKLKTSTELVAPVIEWGRSINL